MSEQQTSTSPGTHRAPRAIARGHVSCTPPLELIEQINEAARKDGRSRAHMVEILITEALEARG